MNWKRLVIVFALSLILILGSSTIAAAKPPAPEPSATLLVTGFEEFQGSTVGPGGALYVTAPLTDSISPSWARPLTLSSPVLPRTSRATISSASTG